MGMVVAWTPVADDEVRAAAHDPDVLDAILDEDRPGTFDVDKAWHGLHGLLTGTAWEVGDGLGRVVLGGREIGVDLGYGPARHLDPAAVAELAQQLARLDPDAIVGSVDLTTLAALDLYPDVWSRPEEADEQRRWLADALRTVQDGFVACADRGLGLLVTIM
jgi:hypothetical protein